MRNFLKRPEALILLVSVWLVITCNVAYWSVVFSARPPTGASTSVYMLSVFILTIGLVSLVLSLLAVGFATRFILTLALLLGSAAGYFSAEYGVLFDASMLTNVIQTDVDESYDLMSLPLLITVFLFGVLPAILVWRYPFRKRGFGAALLGRTVALLVSFVMIVGPLLLSQKEIYSLARNHREIRHLIAPANIVSASYSVIRDELEGPARYRQIGLDAEHALVLAHSAKPTVHVLVVGETARAANFSLAGYRRPTNPQLQTQNINFLTVDSCGTATAMSLPCMFAAESKDDFDRKASAYEDNLLDIAARAGYKVLWLDNGNGCKGICARVENYDVHHSTLDADCGKDGCTDEILVKELQARLPGIRQDTLIVLHQLGSHGPAYFRRYPDRFRTFQPDCRSSNFGDCTTAEIVNAYDNTILYTDYVVSSAIDALAAESDRINGSLIYVSDHGESLGESGLYLHGMPYRLAPDEQTQVPMIVWFSSDEARNQRIRPECRLGEAVAVSDAPASHDNLFHTELGLLGIETSLYDSNLDLYYGCREQSALADNADSARQLE
ncbi:MAG: phosphoethanolamine--lipid A transferase [Woeseia sp.]